MIRKVNFIALLVYTILLTDGCKKSDETINADPPDPVAGFTFTGGNKPAPHKVVFINTSLYANYYTWDFGDNEYSTTINPEHIYQEGGTYLVCLIAQFGHKQDTVSDTIIILQRPTTVVMSNLTLMEFPANDNGLEWDQGNPPDIFFIITNSSGSVFFTSEVKNDLLITDLPAIYNTGMPYTFATLQTNYYIMFNDYDSIQDYDLMGAYSFPFSMWVPDDGSDYPSELIFDSSI